MTGLPLLLGIGCALGALLAVVLLVVAPPAPRVPLERRTAPGAGTAGTLSRAAERTVGVIERLMGHRGGGLLTADVLEQAGVRMQPPAFVLMVISAALVLALLGLLLTIGTAWTVLVMIVLAALAPLGARILLTVRAARRRSRFAAQLDESLGLIAGGLRAGQSLLRALDAAARESDAPVADEFARVVNETRLGRDLGDALDHTAQRMHSDDFLWVAQAISINRQVGGNLSEVLDRVAGTIRERNEIRRQVKTLAAEGKMSAWVLVLLPIAVFGFLIVTQPTYLPGFVSTIWGVLALVVAGVLLIAGSLWLTAAVKVKF